MTSVCGLLPTFDYLPVVVLKSVNLENLQKEPSIEYRPGRSSFADMPIAEHHKYFAFPWKVRGRCVFNISLLMHARKPLDAF